MRATQFLSDLQSYFTAYQASIQQKEQGQCPQARVEKDAMQLRITLNRIRESLSLPQPFDSIRCNFVDSVKSLNETLSDDSQVCKKLEQLKTRVHHLFERIVVCIQEAKQNTTLSAPFLQSLTTRANALSQFDADETVIKARLQNLQKSLEVQLEEDLAEPVKSKLQACKQCFDAFADCLLHNSESTKSAFEAFQKTVSDLDTFRPTCALDPEEKEKEKLLLFNQPNIQEVFSEHVLKDELAALNEGIPIASTQLALTLESILKSPRPQDFIEPLLNPEHFLLIQCIDLVRKGESVFSSELFYPLEDEFRDFFERESQALKSCSDEALLSKNLLPGNRNSELMAFISRAYANLKKDDFNDLMLLVRLKFAPTDDDLAAIGWQLVLDDAYLDARLVTSYISSPEDREVVQSLQELLARLLLEEDLEKCEELFQSASELNDEELAVVLTFLPDYRKALFLARDGGCLLVHVVEQSINESKADDLMDAVKDCTEDVQEGVYSIAARMYLCEGELQQAEKCLTKCSEEIQVWAYTSALMHLVQENTDDAVAVMQHANKLVDQFDIEKMAQVVADIALTNLENATKMVAFFSNQETKDTLYLTIVETLFESSLVPSVSLNQAKQLFSLVHDQDSLFELVFGAGNHMDVDNDVLKKMIEELPAAMQPFAWARLSFRVAMKESFAAASEIVSRFCQDQESAFVACLSLAPSVKTPAEFSQLLDRIELLQQKDKCLQAIFQLFSAISIQGFGEHYIQYAILAERRGYKGYLEMMCSAISNLPTTDLSSEDVLASTELCVKELLQKAARNELSLSLSVPLFTHPAIVDILNPESKVQFAARLAKVCIDPGVHVSGNLQRYLLSLPSEKIAALIEECQKQKDSTSLLTTTRMEIVLICLAFLVSTHSDRQLEQMAIASSSKEIENAYKAFQEEKRERLDEKMSPCLQLLYEAAYIAAQTSAKEGEQAFADFQLQTLLSLEKQGVSLKI